MGTRSTIALEFADGTVEQVYCHWDGYLNHNGRMLMKHYSDPFKLRDLIDLGSLSSLRAEIGIKRSFDCPYPWNSVEREQWDDTYADMCMFYARDRGEPLQKNKFWNFEMYSMTHNREEYAYILRDINGAATWFVAIGEGEFIELTSAFVTDMETA